MKKDTQISELRRDVNRKENYGKRKQEEVYALQRQRKQQIAAKPPKAVSGKRIRKWIDENTEKMLDYVDLQK